MSVGFDNSVTNISSIIMWRPGQPVTVRMIGQYQSQFQLLWVARISGAFLVSPIQSIWRSLTRLNWSNSSPMRLSSWSNEHRDRPDISGKWLPTVSPEVEQLKVGNWWRKTQTWPGQVRATQSSSTNNLRPHSIFRFCDVATKLFCLIQSAPVLNLTLSDKTQDKLIAQLLTTGRPRSKINQWYKPVLQISYHCMSLKNVWFLGRDSGLADLDRNPRVVNKVV
ncbi:hypothetical protein DFH08DRAFT_933690 [Mycena albidolilacea]|uniref:Uncharacterized protein n=1 Tax=Mycena albidolilacea TaxID=1033008 RepID=A0AAD7AE05_9AGAR|nr:hypothetical protein DFH08DRAFT_933690 [Mycena albidolilacea]